MKNRLGGLARRATYIEKLKKDKTPFLHLDAGDAFHKANTLTETERPGVRSAAKVYLASFKRMGLQAYTIGDRDLSLGISELKSLARKASFPFLSSNLTDKKSGAQIFKGHVLLTKGGYKVAVIGATTAVFFNRAQYETKEGVVISPPETAVQKEIAAAKRKGAQLFVLLGHLNESEVERTVKANPDISIVLGGQWVKMDSRPKRVADAWVVGAYMRGKNLSVMDLFVQDGSLAFVDRNARAQLERQKNLLDARIKGRQRSIDDARKNPARKGSLDYLERNLVQLKTELQEVMMDLDDFEEPGQDSSYLKWEMVGMDTGLTDNARVADLVAKHRKTYPDPTKKPRPPRVPQPALKAQGTNAKRAPAGRPARR